MLKFAVARSTRRYVSQPARWARRASTSSEAPSHHEPKRKSIKELLGEDLNHEMQTLPEGREFLESIRQGMEDPEMKELMESLLLDTAVEAKAKSGLPKLSQTEEELFGRKIQALPSQQAIQSYGLKTDPATLPRARTLDPYNTPYSEEEYAMTLVHGRGAHPPFFHPRTHDIPVANIHFRSHHVPLLNLFTHFATHAASSLGIPVSKVVALPTKRTLWTVLRSPFAHKKSQENFERKVHKRAIKAWDADPEVVQRWIAYLRKHAMAGVGMRVTTWERLPLGLGAAGVAEIGVKDLKGGSEGPERIKALGHKIAIEEKAQSRNPPDSV